MTLRSNLASPSTRWTTIALLASSLAAVVILIVMLLSIPAISAGASELATWLIALQIISIAAVGLSVDWRTGARASLEGMPGDVRASMRSVL